MSDLDSKGVTAMIYELSKATETAIDTVTALRAERDKYRAIALRLIRVYRVDDQAWAPDDKAEKMLEKEICK